MHQRSLRLLARVIGSMFSLLILMFLVVLFSGMFVARNPVGNIQVSDQIGTVVSKRLNGKRVWVSHFSLEQLNKRLDLDDWVYVPSSGCALGEVSCLLKSETARQGVEIIYSKETPATFPRSLPWYGGFINPLNSAFYDLFGRGYRVNSAQAQIQVEQHN